MCIRDRSIPSEAADEHLAGKSRDSVASSSSSIDREVYYQQQTETDGQTRRQTHMERDTEKRLHTQYTHKPATYWVATDDHADHSDQCPVMTDE